MVLVPYIKYHINNDIGSSNIGDSDKSNKCKGGIANRNCSYSLCFISNYCNLWFNDSTAVQFAVVVALEAGKYYFFKNSKIE